MKKILFILPFLSSGGAERVVSIWTSELAKLGVKTHLLVFYRVEGEYPIDEGVTVHAIKENKDQYNKMSKFEKIKLLRGKLKKINPDVIIPFISHVGIMTNIARVGLKTKMIETIRNNPKRNPQSKIFRLLRNTSVLLAGNCIVQNEEQKNYFPKWFGKKIQVFANPISDEFVKGVDLTEKLKITSIIAIGRLEAQKNHLMLINSFSKLKNTELTLSIYGEGSLKNELQNLIDSLGCNDRVKLLGRSNNIKEILVNSDLFILSSDLEGMPNALMEAMAVGLPCISTDCPTGPSDLIDNGINGILIPIKDEEALVDSINHMLNNPKEAYTMGKKAKEKMKNNYSAAVSAKKLLRFLNEI